MATAKIGQVDPIVGQGLLARAFTSGAQAGAQAASNYTQGMGAIERERTSRMEIASRARIAQMQAATEMARANLAAQVDRESMAARERMAGQELGIARDQLAMREQEMIAQRKENELQRAFEMKKVEATEAARRKTLTESPEGQLSQMRLDALQMFNDSLDEKGKPTAGTVKLLRELSILFERNPQDMMAMFQIGMPQSEPGSVNGEINENTFMQLTTPNEIFRRSGGLSYQNSQELSDRIQSAPAIYNRMADVWSRRYNIQSSGAPDFIPEGDFVLNVIDEVEKAQSELSGLLVQSGMNGATATQYASAIMPYPAWAESWEERQQREIATRAAYVGSQDRQSLSRLRQGIRDPRSVQDPSLLSRPGIGGPDWGMYLRGSASSITEPTPRVIPRTQSTNNAAVNQQSGTNSVYRGQ